MTTLHRKIFADFLMYALTAALVLTFVIGVALFFGSAELLARGIGVRTLLYAVALGAPSIFPFAIPVSLLLASLLLFGRLSADNEITAVRACGISLWSLVSPLLLFGALMVLLGAYVNNETAPRSRLEQRRLLESLRTREPSEWFPAGQSIRDFPGLVIWVERREEDRLYNLRVYDQREGMPERDVAAERGRVYMEGDDFVLDLFDVTIDPFDEVRPGVALVGRWPIRIPDVQQRSTYRKRAADYTFLEIVGKMQAEDGSVAEADPEARVQGRMDLAVELHQRLALAAASFAFVLVGIPLGIKAHRRESSISGAISLAVILFFYFFVLIADSLRQRPEFRPDIIIWLPVWLTLLLGWRLLRQADG